MNKTEQIRSEQAPKNNGQEFLRIVKENSELPIVCIVDNEVCGGDDYGWWLGSFGRTEVTEYTTVEIWGDGRMITRSDQDEAEEYFANKILDEHPELTDEEVEKQAHEQAENLSWTKAIIVYIGLPDNI